MINNLIIIVFFASWTLLFLILILIGYFVEKSYKLASISPKFKDQPPSSCVTINPIIMSNIQSQPQSRKESKVIEDVNSHRLSQQVVDEMELENKEQMENTSPRRRTSDRKSPLKTTRSLKKFQQPSFKKPTIGAFESIETIQSSNRKSIKSTSRNSAIHSERNSIQSPGQRILSTPRVSSFSVLQTNVDPNYKLPKPRKFYYKLNPISKIFYSHKQNVSRIHMLIQIYFRQIMSFEICGVFFIFLPNLNYFIVMACSMGGLIVQKIIGYCLVRNINQSNSKILKLVTYFIWVVELTALILGILLYKIDGSYCLLIYCPTLILDLLILEPIRYYLVKNCLAEPHKRNDDENSHQVNVFKVMEQVK